MKKDYSETDLTIGENEWYFTQFCVESYTREIDWDARLRRFNQVAETVEILLDAFLEADTFGDAELTALKSTIQISGTVGIETTCEQINQTGGSQRLLEGAVDRLRNTDSKGIVGGTAYHASVPDPSTENALLEVFETLTDESATTDEYDAAAKQLLDLNLGNVGTGTVTPILCLLHPTRYPIINNQPVKAFNNLFNIHISKSRGDYFDMIPKFESVRSEFGFKDHYRHLDHFCYWVREKTDIEQLYLENNIEDRTVWQINAGQAKSGDPEKLWPVWVNNNICSIGWDAGDLSSLSTEEIESRAREWDGENVATYLKRFVNEISPGQIVVAKDGYDLLGVGVTTRAGYHYCDDLIQEECGIAHPHVWPVKWLVVPEDTDAKTNEWQLSPGLQHRITLSKTNALEQLRWVLAQKDSDLIPDLKEIEQTVQDPPISTLPDECNTDSSNEPGDEEGLEPERYESIKVATEDVLAKLGQADVNLLTAELVSEDVEEWSSALSGIESNVTITTDTLEQCQRLLDLYEHLENDLEDLAEQHRIGSLNRASPPETVFLALGRDLQSRVGTRVNLNQVKWGVLRGEAYDMEGAGSIEPPADPPADAQMVAQQLEKTGQVVFYGPPGTGKTYTAQQFARWWINEQSAGATRANQLELTTFHPSFSYEDFIEGLTAKEQDGAVEYVVEPGVFKQICKRAERAYRNSDSLGEAPPYVLIIDEINRGNLAQIFGELMTLLEIDKRLDAPNETQSRLAHSNESFVVPPNLYLIGTMNTADESIALLDTALRRRFRFHAFPPNFDVVAEEYGFPAGWPQSVLREGGAPRDQLVAASIVALEELNERIRSVNQLGKGKQLGHTYLFGHDRIEGVRDTWRFDILPQLEDYYFGKFDRLQSDLFGSVAVTLIDWEAERIAEFTPETLYEELCSIAGIEDYAPLGRPIETDGAAPSSESSSEDSWAAGKKTPETFRDRITENTDEPVRGRLLELYDIGDELGELDPGRGDYTASLTMDVPEFDPGVGLFQIDDNGKFGFRWNWLIHRDQNDLTPEDVEGLWPLLEPIDPYSIEWRENEETDEQSEFDDNDLYLEEITDEEFEQLTTAIRELTAHIRTEIVDADD